MQYMMAVINSLQAHLARCRLKALRLYRRHDPGAGQAIDRFETAEYSLIKVLRGMR